MIHVENGAVEIKGNSKNELGADFCFLCKTLEKEGLLVSFQVAYEIMRDDPESFQLLSSISYKKRRRSMMREYNRDFVQSTGWRYEWAREWEAITGKLKKYDLNRIELISSEMADVRREKKLNGKN